MAIDPPLNQGWGYGIVLGLGALFALGMVRFSVSLAISSANTICTGARDLDSETLQQ